jgi:hypothetical protein
MKYRIDVEETVGGWTGEVSDISETVPVDLGNVVGRNRGACINNAKTVIDMHEVKKQNQEAATSSMPESES